MKKRQKLFSMVTHSIILTLLSICLMANSFFSIVASAEEENTVEGDNIATPSNLDLYEEDFYETGFNAVEGIDDGIVVSEGELILDDELVGFDEEISDIEGAEEIIIDVDSENNIVASYQDVDVIDTIDEEVTEITDDADAHLFECRYAMVQKGASVFSSDDKSVPIGVFTEDEMIFIQSIINEGASFYIIFDTAESINEEKPLSGLVSVEVITIINDDYIFDTVNTYKNHKTRFIDSYFIPVVENFIPGEDTTTSVSYSIIDSVNNDTTPNEVHDEADTFEISINSIITDDSDSVDVYIDRADVTTVGIKWTELSNVEYYELFRKVDDGNWNKIKNVFSTSTLNLNLESEHWYYYKIRAKFLEGTYSDYFYADGYYLSNTLKCPQNLTIDAQGQSSARLTWEPVDDAQEYILYRSINGGTWTKLKTVSECSAINYGLNESNTYGYKVIARADNEYSDSSDIVTFVLPMKMPVPTITVSQYAMNTAILTCNVLEDVKQYNIYRSEGSNNWKLVKSSNNNQIYNYALKEGITYYYKVNAVYEANGITKTSDFSDVVEFKLGSVVGIPGATEIRRVSNTCSSITWNEVEGATGYSLYRSEDGTSWKKIKDIESNGTRNYSLVLGNVYYYYIRAYKETELGRVYGLSSETMAYWNCSTVKIELISSENNTINWNSIPGADYYIVYLDNDLFATTSDTSFTFSNETMGEVSVTAYKTYNKQSFESEKSNEVHIERIIEIQYRALLIGETTYAQKLNGPENDVVAMSNILSGLNMGYDVYSQIDATKEEIIDLIEIAYSDATEDDVSLFYYSGHGITGSGVYYSGAIQTIDYQYITTQDLAELLSQIPGKVIVIMDSCGSGATISDDELSTNSLNSQSMILSLDERGEDDEIDDIFDVDRFSEGLIDAFQSANSSQSSAVRPNGPRKAKELAASKFYVLTGSAYEELSLTTNSSGVWGGLLTKGIASCTGFSYPGDKFQGVLIGDVNGDGAISLKECASYCSEYVEERQHVLSYPSESAYSLFFIGE